MTTLKPIDGNVNNLTLSRENIPSMMIDNKLDVPDYLALINWIEHEWDGTQERVMNAPLGFLIHDLVDALKSGLQLSSGGKLLSKSLEYEPNSLISMLSELSAVKVDPMNHSITCALIKRISELTS